MRLAVENAKLEGERAVAALREERLQLKEAALTAEENAMEKVCPPPPLNRTLKISP